MFYVDYYGLALLAYGFINDSAAFDTLSGTCTAAKKRSNSGNTIDELLLLCLENILGIAFVKNFFNDILEITYSYL